MKLGTYSRQHKNSTGFTLIEILVGMAIGLIGMVMMYQIMENSETRKRTTAAGGDAQIAGSIALFNLERDIRLAGHGFSNSTSLGCTVNAYDSCTSASAASMGCPANAPAAARGAFTYTLTPLQIVNGAAGAPDQIAILYGNSAADSTSHSFDASTTSTKKMASTSNRGGLQLGDLVLVASGANCGMIEVTGNANGDQLTIDHATGAYTDFQNVASTTRYNPPAGYNIASGQVFNLGNRTQTRRNVWQIANGRTLTVTDDIHSTTAAEIGEGIINLQAEYGLDTTATRDYLVDTWQATAPADWTRLIAVRVALLARSQQFEKTAIPNYATCAIPPAVDPASCQRPTWVGGNFTMTNVDGTTDSNPVNSSNNWRHYRYRVYQTTIPLRNMIWGTMP